MSKKKKMPHSSVNNGLKVEKMPPDLTDMTNTENQLIAIDIPFMKIRKVPKSQIEKMEDRSPLVSIEPTDITYTIGRTLEMFLTILKNVIREPKLKRLIMRRISILLKLRKKMKYWHFKK